ncbi:MAG: D-tyrosyl-tRNA(Tyr) deacylase [Bacteroidales bacterium]|jgi:D-tyrosyl-tRNA(Tyr) deacylase|nr:D-tyrosyl-tRNA(Tyr) deacylase [Bacteroidales bacterium]
MRLVIQRVTSASVTIAGALKSAIGKGLMILIGICDEDTDEDIDYLCRKVVQMRIFPDAEGVMNLPITDIADSGILVVSQFTLMASTKKGNRPSYFHASRPEFAVPMYEKFVLKMQELFGKEIQTGEFGADMQVALVNDGPVTIIMDSHQRERF